MTMICVYTTCRSPPWLHEAHKTCSKVSSCLRVLTALTRCKMIFLRHGNVRFHNGSGMILFGPLTALQSSQYTRVFRTLKDWQKSQMKPLLWIKYNWDLSLGFLPSEWARGYSEQQEVLYLQWIECVFLQSVWMLPHDGKRKIKTTTLQQKNGPMVIVHIFLKSGTPTQALRKAVRKRGWHQMNFRLHFLGKVSELTLFLKNWMKICLVMK